MNYKNMEKQIVADFQSMPAERKGEVLQGIAETFYQFQYERPAYERDTKALGWKKGERWIELGIASKVAKSAGFDIPKAVASIRAISLPKLITRLEREAKGLKDLYGGPYYAQAALAVKKLPALKRELEALKNA